MAEVTTQLPTTESSELFEADPIAEAEATPPETTPEAPPTEGETPPPVEEPPAETPPVVEPPVEAAPAAPAAAPPAEPERPGRNPTWSELRQLRQQLAEREALIQQLTTRAPAPTPQHIAQPSQPGQPPQAPDPNEDPVGYMQWQQEQLALGQQQLMQQNAAIQQRQAAVELQNLITTQINDFKGRQVDYTDAAQFLEQREIGRWKAMGYTDAEAIQATQQRAMQVVASALHLGRSVPEALYEIALADGWSPPNGSGTTAATAAGAAASTPQARVEASKAKTAASRTSMGNVGGAPSPGRGYTKEQIRNMSEDEIDKAFGDANLENITLLD